MTYDTRTSSFVVPEESMRLAENQLKAAIRELRQLHAELKEHALRQNCISAERNVLTAMHYIGLYTGQNKPHELNVSEQ
ncbi:hypothetical protein ACXR0O_19055 [Verrucomicrobiota bacterium sgz303538]